MSTVLEDGHEGAWSDPAGPSLHQRTTAPSSRSVCLDAEIQRIMPEPEIASASTLLTEEPYGTEQASSLGRLMALDATAASSAVQRAQESLSAEPWERPQEVWDALEPTNVYARRVRGPLLYSLALVLAVPACCLALPIVLVNWFVHRRLAHVLFSQERVGRHGRVFSILKFRTMLSEPGDDQSRVTRFGRFLRGTHLDELPQLLNVLAGDMALIGPRPEMVSIERWANERLPGFAERLVFRPGITGWAQITQGYTAAQDEAAYARKLAINSAYRERLSLGTDLEIVFRTALWMLLGRGWKWKPAEELTDDRAEQRQAAPDPLHDMASGSA